MIYLAFNDHKSVIITIAFNIFKDVIEGLQPMIFSSPEPKAHGELIVYMYQSSRRLCVWV